MPDLVLGPVLRYVDDRQATVWVQADERCEVEVLGHRTQTFEVEGHHFALVVVGGLQAATRTPYRVALDGRAVWPPPDFAFPPSVIQTVGRRRTVRLAFGSCREVAPHEPPFVLDDAADPRGHGIDALRTYALELARSSPDAWPDALLMLGDQLYADEPPRRLRGVLRARGDGHVRAVTFSDYAALYRVSWQEAAVRWLLSTVPSMMIFDDHEIVDEWKISRAWVQERHGRPDHERRVTAGLMAYWVFQHLGNLAPQELAADPFVDRIPGSDGSRALRELAADADREVGMSRWSFCRDLGHTRLLVLDSRASRRLEPGDRRILDEPEWGWATARMAESGAEHLLLASSLPFVLPRGLHDLEAALERLADGARGRRVAAAAEAVRRALNLGHWASFQASFRALAGQLEQRTRASGGSRLASVLMLSGDVHHGYLARVGDGPVPVWQIVCSPFRKRLSGHERTAMRLSETPFAARVAGLLRRAAGVPATPLAWRLTVRPRYDNQVAVLELDGAGAWVRTLTPAGSDWRAPRLRTLWHERLA